MAGNNSTVTLTPRLLEYWDVWSILITLGVLIIISNLVIIIIYTVWKQIRTPTNTFLVMLAIADLLVGLLFIPLYIGGHYIEFYQNVVVTEYLDVIIIFTFYASVFNLYAVTLDRYIAVMHALRYNALMTTSVVRWIVAAAWLLPMLIVSGLLICKIINPDIYVVVMFGFELVFVIIPSGLMTVVYVKIFMEARRQINVVAALEVRIGSGNSGKARASKRRSEQKVAKTCALLLFVFLVCWIPTCIEQILNMARTEPSIVYTDIALILLISNSAVNPILYGIFKQDFRSKLKKIFRWNNKESSVQPTLRTPRLQTLGLPLNSTRNGSQVSVRSNSNLGNDKGKTEQPMSIQEKENSGKQLVGLRKLDSTDVKRV